MIYFAFISLIIATENYQDTYNLIGFCSRNGNYFTDVEYCNMMFSEEAEEILCSEKELIMSKKSTEIKHDRINTCMDTRENENNQVGTFIAQGNYLLALNNIQTFINDAFDVDTDEANHYLLSERYDKPYEYKNTTNHHQYLHMAENDKVANSNDKESNDQVEEHEMELSKNIQTPLWSKSSCSSNFSAIPPSKNKDDAHCNNDNQIIDDQNIVRSLLSKSGQCMDGCDVEFNKYSHNKINKCLNIKLQAKCPKIYTDKMYMKAMEDRRTKKNTTKRTISNLKPVIMNAKFTKKLKSRLKTFLHLINKFLYSSYINYKSKEIKDILTQSNSDNKRIQDIISLLNKIKKQFILRYNNKCSVEIMTNYLISISLNYLEEVKELNKNISEYLLNKHQKINNSV